MLTHVFHVLPVPGSVPDKEVVKAQSLSTNTTSISVGEEVVWCIATQDICTVAPNISNNNLTMSTSTAVITIDETPTFSSGTSAICSGNTHSLSTGPTISANGQTRCISANHSTGMSHESTQPSTSSTSYRSMFWIFLSLFIQYFYLSGLYNNGPYL